ncbi:MAG: trypsin-like peptidase domain-containing protein [Candidatus Desulforudis sp.]|nr:trypsin-like peptidase domain-containing protein [Desulforudis sp.]
MQWKRVLVFIALAAFVAGIMFAVGNALVRDIYEKEPAVADDSPQARPERPGLDPGVIVDIVDRTSPAVAKIDTVIPGSGSEWGPLFNDPFFRDFFGRPYMTPPGPSRRGMGSGFLFSADGYILTNEHVIRNAEEIWVTLTGFDAPLQAKLVGSDYDLDLAVLKVDAPRKLPYLTLGDSDEVQVGEWVIAIGNPYGLDHTVTVGVVSAKGRPVTIEDRYYDNLLQTDASINPGNSGGPLLNLRGEVVAINTAVNAQAQGIGFAIPTTTVRPVLDELIKTGGISHAWLGVQLESVSPELAQYLDLKNAAGAFVRVVVAESPAARAGLKAGDVILELDGAEVDNPEKVIRAIRTHKVGEGLDVKVFREGRTLSIEVKLGEKPTR